MKKFRVTVEGQTYEVEVEELNESGQPVAGGGSTGASSAGGSAAGAGSARPASSSGGSGSAGGGGAAATADSSGATAAGGGIIEAPIAGNVFDLKVSVGDKVEKGQVVMILEAMKMENEITADGPGTVKEIKANKGATVNAGDPLIVLE